MIVVVLLFITVFFRFMLDSILNALVLPVCYLIDSERSIEDIEIKRNA